MAVTATLKDGTQVRFLPPFNLDAATIFAGYRDAITDLIEFLRSGEFTVGEMTKRFSKHVVCPRCRMVHTAESAFDRWLRDNPALGSDRGLVAMDNDVLVHRFKFYGDRTFQCLMWVEVKAFGAQPEPWQLDTLALLDAVLRNRRSTPMNKVKTNCRPRTSCSRRWRATRSGCGCSVRTCCVCPTALRTGRGG